MLISIMQNRDATTLALSDAGKLHLILTSEEITRILEIIDLLQVFKESTDKLGVQDDITITLIIPTFAFFRKTLTEVKEGESSMIKSMKIHMLNKLESRYSKPQIEYLSQCTFLDPRFKKTVSFDLQSFTERVKDIALSYTEIIHDTESQSLENIENPSFSNTHTRRELPTASTSNNTRETVHGMFIDDLSEDETELTNSQDIIRKISLETDRFKSIVMKKEQKANIKLISWWQERKPEYPFLFKAVKAMLCTPATSVPSERIFSEAGYISRAKRSKILPVNLDKYLFIKRNKIYLPEKTHDYFTSEEA